MPSLVYQDQEFALDGELILGRHSGSGIRVEDAKASRRHARVFDDGGVYAVEDLGSSNGTLLNDEPLTGKRRLRDGDRIRIGKKQIVFKAVGTPAAKKTASPRSSTMHLNREIGGYRLEKMIGAGLLGAVYQATQLSMGRKVALKVFDEELVQANPALADAFRKEVKRLGNISHENFVQIHECGHDQGILWYSMELVEGKSLQELLDRDDTIEPTIALLVTQRIAEALYMAHVKGVCHRDIRPSNIMLTQQGGIKLLDLGLAEILANSRDSRVGSLSSSSLYFSPEQSLGGKVDLRSDIYSLGCTLFHLVAGRPPYIGKNAKEVTAQHVRGEVPNLKKERPDLPEKLGEILLCMMNKNPEWRYESMREVAKEIGVVYASMEQVKSVKSTLSDRHNVSTAMIAVRLEKARAKSMQSWAVRLLVVVAACIAISFALPYLSRKPASESAKPAVAKATPKPAAPVLTPARAAVTKSAAESALEKRWLQLQSQVDRDVLADQWGSAERKLKLFAADAAGTSLAESVRLRQAKLALDGAQWYRAQVAALPDIRDARNIQHGLLAKCLTDLDRLRDQTLSDNRADAESRYQEVLSRLLQQIGTARRQARRELEQGHPEAVAEIAKPLEVVFRGTPVIGLYRQFAALTEAAGQINMVPGASWTSTMEQLKKARGADALAAGAALIVGGDPESGKKLLFSDPQLETGELSDRREAMLGREAAMLSFSDVADLQFIETLVGDPRFSDGALSGPSGEACGIACSVPVGGDHWDAKLIASLRDVSADDDADGGQAVISCCKGDNAEFLVRVEKEHLVIRAHTAAGWQEQKSPLPSLTPLTIRILCRAGKLQVFVNNEAAFECEGSVIPPKSEFRFEVSGMNWSLDELQVVGGD